MNIILAAVTTRLILAGIDKAADIFMIYRAMDSFNGDKTVEAAKEVAGKASGYLSRQGR